MNRTTDDRGGLRRLGVLGCVVVTGLGACQGGSGGGAADGGAGTAQSPQVPLRPPAMPTEFVGVTLQRRVSSGDLDAILGPLFGQAARGGQFLTDYPIAQGFTLSSQADPRTPEQAILTLAMAVSGGGGAAPRTVIRVPASFQYGTLFLDTVAAAIAQSEAKFAEDPANAEPFRLEYRVRSANGGRLVLKVDFDATRGDTRLVVQVEGPRTSLAGGSVNAPAMVGDPYETLYGNVRFSLSRDEFDFFVNRAYGITPGAQQNFRDFRLRPHEWLRLTVDPLLDQGLVSVGFEVVTLDGRRVPVSRAPASLKAGEQFMQTVLRMVDNMLAEEAAAAGSSLPFEVPFYYDDPNGGGVVEVIANGVGGKFKIAYAVESPINTLRDVDFVPYVGEVKVPDGWADAAPSCEAVGSEAAAQGYFTATFSASSTVRGSTTLDGPLVGNIWGSVYRHSDLDGFEPRAGVSGVASFYVEGADLRDPAHPPTLRIPTQLLAGDYALLGFIDIDGNADPNDPGPDPGDPVTVPIGANRLECAEQPTVVEFSILLPR